ncbi:MAG: RIP metalloprotease RseP [Clostridia bacterium]|nr:RIP metalloprotease RseP [Clostridia bacterium]
MDIVLQIVYTVLILGFLIFIHEFGHFICAKLTKTKVNEFALGMGPAIFKKQMGETLYALRLFPIGGYVAMEGEDDASEDPNGFDKKNIWARLLIVSAGALMNLVLGFIITLILVMRAGIPSLTVGEFMENSVSDDYGLQIGDVILKIDDRKIGDYVDIGTAFALDFNLDSVDVTVLRDGEEVVLEDVVFPKVEQADGLSSFSVDFKVYGKEKTFGNVMKETFSRTGSYISMMYESIGQLITGKMSVKYVSGPVGISSAIADSAKLGLDAILSLVSLISLNLAVMNLLPLPALDGGRLIFLLIELVTRKRVPKKYEAVVHFVGLVALLILMVLIVFKDIFFPVY